MNVINSGMGIDTVSGVAVTYPGGDPNVTAIADTNDDQVVLQARVAGFQGNQVAYAATTSTGAQITASRHWRRPDRGRRRGQRRAGYHRVDQRNQSGVNHRFGRPDPTALPTQLGGVQVYFNGIVRLWSWFLQPRSMPRFPGSSPTPPA